eukprot:Clim_evm9s42 gene=Clim_evmTU9s42
MVEFYDPTGLWMWFSNFFFLLAAVFTDLLLIRGSLSIAYMFLLINAACGLPRWPYMSVEGYMSLDGVIVATFVGFFHCIATWRLMWDERPLKFDARGEELYRFFYRRCGMNRLECREVLKRGRFVHFKEGQEILTLDESRRKCYIVIRGVVELRISDVRSSISGNSLDLKANHDATAQERLVRSGHFFDFYLINLCGINVGCHHSTLDATAHTDCVLFELTTCALNDLLWKQSSAMAHYLRSFFMYCIAAEYNMRVVEDASFFDALGREEEHDYINGAKSRDFTEPLKEDEIPKKGYLSWILGSLTICPPPGLRHSGLPPSAQRHRGEVLTRYKQMPDILNAVELGDEESQHEMPRLPSTAKRHSSIYGSL